MATDEFYNAAFSSKNGKWDTDPALIRELAPVFHWSLDVCASRPNVCETYFDEAKDGLACDWFGLCWMNPVYGRTISKWMSKARREVREGRARAVVCLVPSRTDTKWFQDSARVSSLIVHLSGRLQFGTPEHWKAHYCAAFEEIVNDENLRRSVWEKKLTAILSKLGGAHASEHMIKLAPVLFKSVPSFEKWRSAEYIKPDGAPFPSSFVVLGEISLAQKRKLASMGLALVRPEEASFPTFHAPRYGAYKRESSHIDEIEFILSDLKERSVVVSWDWEADFRFAEFLFEKGRIEEELFLDAKKLVAPRGLAPFKIMLWGATVRKKITARRLRILRKLVKSGDALSAWSGTGEGGYYEYGTTRVRAYYDPAFLNRNQTHQEAHHEALHSEAL